MSQETKVKKNSERLLVEELERLKRTYGYGRYLKVRYLPGDGDRSKRGEVIGGDAVYVYDEGLKEAVETLRHEYLDHAVTKEVIEPLVDLVNLLTSLVVKQVYRRKEELVDRFSTAI